MIEVSAAVLKLFFSGSVLSWILTRRLEFLGFLSFDADIISDVMMLLLLPLFVEFVPFETADEAVELDDDVEDVVDAAMWLLQGAVV